MRGSVVQQERDRGTEKERERDIYVQYVQRERDAVIYDSAVGL